MSLPTYAIFFNKDDEEIAHQFVNVGWWVTEENWVDAVMSLPWVRGAEYASLYGIRIPKEVLLKKDEEGGMDYRTKHYFIKEYAKTEVAKWVREHGDLRAELKKIYEAEQKKEKK